MPVSPPTFLSCLAACLLIFAIPAAAQTQSSQTPPSIQSLEGKGSCGSANKAEAATPPDRRSGDSTVPGNIGSTGWTGGTGGAHMGTSPQGALQESKTWQPPTARGLDLAMAIPSDPPAASKAETAQGC